MPKSKMFAWLAAIIWMALIFTLSHQPGSVSGNLSAEIAGLVMDLVKETFGGSGTEIETLHTIVRKNAHFIAYFILGSLLLNAMKATDNLRVRDIFVSFAVSVVYAVSDEVHQLFIDGRSGEVRDVLIDSAGAGTGIAFCWMMVRFRKRQI